MSDERFLEAPPTPEEEAAARRLAEALENGEATADDSIAAARLLQAIAASGGDELAGRRLRRELVREAGRARRMRRLRSLAAAAILVSAGATALLLSRHRPANDLASLAAREAAARAAVAQLLEQSTGSGRLATLTNNLRESRYDSLWKSRLDTVLGSTGGAARPSPTPGGPAS